MTSHEDKSSRNVAVSQTVEDGNKENTAKEPQTPPGYTRARELPPSSGGIANSAKFHLNPDLNGSEAVYSKHTFSKNVAVPQAGESGARDDMSQEAQTPPGYKRCQYLPQPSGVLPKYPGKAHILFKDPFDPNVVQPAMPTIKIDARARIAELEWCLQQPEYELQYKNISAVITYYKQGKLPREDLRWVIFRDGEEYDPKSGPDPGGVEWLEGLGKELANPASFPS